MDNEYKNIKEDCDLHKKIRYWEYQGEAENN